MQPRKTCLFDWGSTILAIHNSIQHGNSVATNDDCRLSGTVNLSLAIEKETEVLSSKSEYKDTSLYR